MPLVEATNFDFLSTKYLKKMFTTCITNTPKRNSLNDSLLTFYDPRDQCDK